MNLRHARRSKHRMKVKTYEIEENRRKKKENKQSSSDSEQRKTTEEEIINDKFTI